MEGKKDIWYAQTQARRILRMLQVHQPGGPVLPAFLQGMDEAEFWRAWETLHTLLISYYTRAAADPAAQGLPQVEIETNRSTATEARKSFHAAPVFALTLSALGAAGMLHGNAMTIDPAALRQYAKRLGVGKLPAQINLLGDYGFLFTGWNGKKLPSGSLEMEFPDHPQVMAVVAALGEKARRFLSTDIRGTLHPTYAEPLMELNPALFADDSATPPARTAQDMARFVGDDAPSLQAILEAFQSRGLTLRVGDSYLKNGFYTEKGKDSLNNIVYGDYRNDWANETLLLRLKLNRPQAYIERIDALPDRLRQTFMQVWCAHCTPTCNRRVTYTLDGEQKDACGCFAFVFPNPDPADMDTIMSLYDAEQVARSKK